MDATSPAGPPDPRYRMTGLAILLLASGMEVSLLYLLIAVETPLTPVVRRLMQNPFGVFVLVMSALVVVSLLMTGLLAIRERRQRHHP